MAGLCEDLAAVLDSVSRPGNFCVGGRQRLHSPRITVDGVGELSLPLLSFQAEQLIASAERAPYGKGPDTLVDTSVRRTWQIASSRVHFGGSRWPITLEAIIKRAAEGLGVEGAVGAQFYKLLIYDPGSFFVSHRDTEKAPGMFATLVMALEQVATLDEHETGDHPAILAGLAQLPPEQASRHLQAILTRHAPRSLDACSALLKAAVEGPLAAERGRLAAVAKTFIAAFPGDPSLTPRSFRLFGRSITPELPVLAELMQTLGCIDPALPGQMVEHMLAWPRVYSLDDAVVPLAKQLRGQGTPPASPALSRLLSVATAHLQSRVAQPLAPPSDWARPCNLPCSCEDCTELRQFLLDPKQSTWTLRAAERVRKHVQGTAAGCDLDFTTDRSGSPYSLVCQKNNASYERRVGQRRRDLADLSILKGDAST